MHLCLPFKRRICHIVFWVLILLIVPFFLQAQALLNGSDAAKFGGDADTRSNVSLFGNAASSLTTTDDWFSNGSTPGIGVLDTTNSWQLQNALQTGTNIEWLGGMAYPQNSIMNGVRLHDASYAKDFFGGSGATDYTSFAQASKNGEDPAIWDDGPHNVLGKNDLIDCYAHLRRDGITINNHLWMYLGFSRIATSGDSYFDAELYVEEMSYSPVDGFPSGGPDEGHTAWGFDAVGNIIKIGDLVTTCHFSTNGAPELELRIWVSRYDFQNTTPTTFNWGGEFDGGSNSSSFGYADIEIPPNEIYGFGLGNSDYAVAPPWGTLNSSGEYTLFYEANQFVEVGLDLTVFGVDPIFLNEAAGADICELPFSNILFKSRASNSFTAQLKDFAGPFPFDYTSEIPVSIAGLDTINCYNEIIELSVQDTIEGSYYTWYTEDGNIISDPNNFLIQITEAGTYIVEGSFVENCEGSRDTIVVVDNFIYPPGAEIDFETIYGCGVSSHLLATPDGYSYNWSGPNNYTANTQDVFVDDEGMYYLEVFNVETGCSAYDSIYVLGYPCQDNIPDTIATTIMLDTIPPDFTAPDDITLDCNADPLDLQITGDVTDESDDCDLNISEAIFTDIISENYPCSGATQIQRYWSAIDDCGNLTVQLQIINLVDNTAPEFIAPADISINCEDDLNDLSLTGEVTNLTDNCDSGTLTTSFSDQISDVPCLGEKLIERTWVVTDDCGNSASSVQIISLIDTVPPVFTVPTDITIECDDDPSDLTLVGDVFDETDNCGFNIAQATYTDVVVADVPCLGASTITRTWNLTDACGNETNASQTITLEDTTPPVLVLVNASETSVECDSIIPIPDVGTELIVTDNCDPNVDISFSEVIIEHECPDKFTMRRVWIATDDCNNQDSIVQEFQVQDTENPIVVVLPSDITLECNETIPDGDAVVDDNCSDQINISFAETTTPGNCPNNMIVERVWDWVDNCGNSESHTQIITIVDTTPPDFTVPDDVALECDQDPNDLTLTGGVTNEEDNCDIGLEATYTDVINQGFPCDGAIQILRTWLLEDGCGNTFSAIQEITLIDNDAPIFTVPEDVTIGCDVNPYDLGLTGDVIDENDNCTVNLAQATYTDSLSTENACSGTGVIFRNWSLEDGCGNVTNAVQQITIVDNIAPQMTTPADVTLSCEDDPTDLSLTGSITNISDNCSSGILNSFYTDSIEVSALCEQNYTIYRIWSLEDACGNDTAYTQIISIEDLTAPLFTAPEDILLDCTQDPSDLLVTGNVELSSDNCDNTLGEATFVDNVIVSGPCPNTTQIERTWTITDACGNTSTAIQQITIEDTTSPSFTTPEDVTIDCNDDPNDLTLTGDVIDETDDCDQILGEATYTDVVSVVGVCTGSSTVERTWSLTDACGNLTTAIQIITLVDNTPPTFTVPADLTLECDDDPYDLSITGDVTDESDNCTSNIGEAFYSDSIRIDSSTCLQSLIILRSWVLVDGCGNDSSAVQTILVEDTTPPVMVTPENITVDCTTDLSDLSILGQPATVTDNCSTGSIVPVYQDSIVPGPDCDGTSTILRIWSAIDACGNNAVDTQQIILINCASDTATTLSAIICEGDSYELGDSVYTTGGTYVTNLLTTVGCDSIVTLNLIVNPAITTELNEVICEGGSYELGDSVYTEAGTYVTNYETAIGCDSIVTLNLIVNPAITIELNEVICEGGSYELGDSVYTTGGTYVTNLLTAVGCDSIVTLNLIVSSSISTELNEVICEGESYELGDSVYTEAGTYVTTFVTDLGCDSIVILTLSTITGASIQINETICQGELYEFGDSVYTETGVYVTTFVTNSGCDSVVTINLIVNTGASTDLSESICEGESYEISDSIYTEAGIYTTVLANAVGCDSIVVLTLVVNSDQTETIDAEICEGDAYDFGGTSYTQSGIYSIEISNNFGCDSLIELNLIVLPHAETFLDAVICEGDTYEFGGEEYTSGGVYTQELTTANGCDSIVHLSLSVSPVYEAEISLSICLGETILIGGDTVNIPGTYIESISSNSACDSLLIYQLTVLNPSLSLQTIEICSGDSIFAGGDFQNTAGAYVDTLSSFNGCDSILITELQLVESIIAYASYETCLGDSIWIGNGYENEAGVYVDTTQSIAGCDSITITELILLDAILTEQSFDVCLGDSILINGFYEIEPGVYFDTIAMSTGCDSIVLTTLYVGDPVEVNQQLSICEGDSIWIAGVYQSEEGIYTDSLQGGNTCDSIINVHLVLMPNVETNQSFTICSGESVFVGGAVQTESGTYVDVFSSIIGCDSIVVTNLIVNLPIESEAVAMICEGDAVIFGDVSVTESGTYLDTLTNGNGCDSIVSLEVQVVQSLSEIVELQICTGDSVLIGGVYESTPGIYQHSYISSGGCDSLVETVLLVLNGFETILNESICIGDSVLFGDVYYSSTGQYVNSYSTTGGCDSVAILNLEVLTPYANEFFEVICEGEVFEFENNDYAASGVYTFEYVQENGCDSTLTLYLDVNPVIETESLLQICHGDSVLIGEEYQSSQGTHIVVYQNQFGCDSIHTTELVVELSYVNEFTQQICQGGGVLINGNYETEPGIYINELSTVFGCDSVEVINLIVVNELTTYLDFELCLGEGIFAGGDYQAESGIYYDTLSSVNGCDSIIITELDLQGIFISLGELMICAGDSILLGGNYITEAGVFSDTLSTDAGCDSIVFVEVGLLPATQFSFSEFICEGDSLLIGNSVYTDAGVYSEILTSYNGCDSIVTIDLEVYPQAEEMMMVTICEGDQYEFAGTLYTESGTYFADLQTDYGCDSTITLALNVLDLSADTMEVSICAGEFFLLEGQVLSTAGTYQYVYTGYSGCDSLLIVDLSVATPVNYVFEDTICSGGEYVFGANVLTDAGVYVETLIGANSCDSIVTLELTVLDVLTNDVLVYICEGDSILINGEYESEQGIYIETFISEAGCDSIVNQALVLMTPIVMEESYLICEGDSVYLGGAYYKTDTTLEMSYSTYQGCDSIMIMSVEVLPVVELLVEDFEICLGETVALSVFGANEVTWSPADGLSCTDCPNPEASPTSTITYTVQAESCLGEVIEEQVTVVVNYPPMIAITTDSDESVVLGDSVLLIASASDPNATIVWTDSDGMTYCSDCDSITVEPYYGVTYIATATTVEGCMDQAELRFSINDDCVEGVLDVPNFITPNGDGHNDKFEVRYSNFSELSILRIYNRWGELVFETDDIMSNFWDGTFKGQTLNPDVYVFYLKGFCLNGDSFLRKGNITIIK